MTIICSECKTIFNSYSLTPEDRFKDLFTQFEQHVTKSHPGEAKNFMVALQNLALACSTYLFIGKFMLIPEGEKEVEQVVDKVRNKILEVLGIEVMEEATLEKEEKSEADLKM